ncbi:hypothetical protein BDK51DRAFT_26021, partial [Blyttiomyces helicus]
NINFDYDLRRCPNAVTPSELIAVGECWRELGMQNYAQARELESNEGLQSFSVVVERVRVSGQEAMQYVAGTATAPNGKRYVVLLWEAAARKEENAEPTSSPPEELVSRHAPPRRLRGFLSAGLILDTGVLFLWYEQISSESQQGLVRALSTLFRGIMEDAEVAPQNFAQSPIKQKLFPKSRLPPAALMSTTQPSRTPSTPGPRELSVFKHKSCKRVRGGSYSARSEATSPWESLKRATECQVR